MSQFPEPCAENGFLAEHVMRLSKSYRRWTGRDLMVLDSGGGATGRELYHAPFALVSHGVGEDPIFNYANLTAQALFAMSWDEMTATPSRKSAEPVNLEERSRLLGEVAAKGFIAHYEGIRISKDGKRFLIRNAVVWNVIDESDAYCGQAACFADWRFF